MKKPLTKTQQKIYSFLSQYIGEKEYSPTLDEIRLFLDISSLNGVTDHLKALEQKGYIYRRKHAKRNIELQNTSINHSYYPTINVPVMASVGCDDLSVFAEEKHDESLEIDKKILGGKENVVAVRAIGNSMNDAGIEDGDYVLIEITDTANQGDRVAVILGDMVTVKKLDKRDGILILRPESKDPKYKPIILSEDFKIAGKVIRTIPGESMDITEVVYS